MGKITSKLSAESRTTVPGEVRDRLGLRPGDTIHYVITPSGVVLMADDEADGADWGDPFICFNEWASPEDEEAFKDL